MAREAPFAAECIWIDAEAAKRLRVLADAEGCSMRAWVEQAIRDVWEWEHSADTTAQASEQEGGDGA